MKSFIIKAYVKYEQSKHSISKKYRYAKVKHTRQTSTVINSCKCEIINAKYKDQSKTEHDIHIAKLAYFFNEFDTFGTNLATFIYKLTGHKTDEVTITLKSEAYTYDIITFKLDECIRIKNNVSSTIICDQLTFN